MPKHKNAPKPQGGGGISAAHAIGSARSAASTVRKKISKSRRHPTTGNFSAARKVTCDFPARERFDRPGFDSDPLTVQISIRLLKGYRPTAKQLNSAYRKWLASGKQPPRFRFRILQWKNPALSNPDWRKPSDSGVRTWVRTNLQRDKRSLFGQQAARRSLYGPLSHARLNVKAVRHRRGKARTR